MVFVLTLCGYNVNVIYIYDSEIHLVLELCVVPQRVVFLNTGAYS